MATTRSIAQRAAGAMALAVLLSAPHGPGAASPSDDGIQDAIGVENPDGTFSTYTDPFCAGYATAFVAHGGERDLTPECPAEPLEPLEVSPHEKGERAGRASAEAFAAFRKQQSKVPAAADVSFLPGFYDASRDIWASNTAGVQTTTSFDKGRLAVVSKEDDGMGVVDKQGRLIVPFGHSQVGMERSEKLITVRTQDDRVAMYTDTGKVLVPLIRGEARALDDQHILVAAQGQYRVVEMTGKTLFTTDRNVESAGEGLFWFMQAPQRFGLLDSAGKQRVAPEFTYTSAFQGGKLTSQKNDGENYTIYSSGKVERQR